jgi:hypothetical protein
MSHDTHSPGAVVFTGGKRVLNASLGLAAVGVALLVIGLFVDRTRLFFAYLTAYAYVVSIVVGALLFLMICHAMRAGWPVAIRRLTEGIVSTLPLLAVLFIPLVFGLHVLYPWIDPASVTDPHARHLIEHKQPYLNVPFFLIRTGVYFVIWTAVGLLLCRWSAARDRDPERLVDRKLYGLSAGALPPVAIAVTFASFDWLMSLEPTWVSTMFPVYFFAGGFLGALACLTVLTASAQRAGLLPGISSSHYYALGRLLLGFTVFWAYAAFFQFMLIWMANQPSEVEFYLLRIRGPWSTVTAILVIVHFVFPFLILLNYHIKRVPSALATIAVWLLVAHYLDVHWLVVPLAGRAGFPFSFLDLGALLAVGGVTVAFGVLQLRGRPLLPINDPALPRALEYKSV